MDTQEKLYTPQKLGKKRPIGSILFYVVLVIMSLGVSAYCLITGLVFLVVRHRLMMNVVRYSVVVFVAVMNASLRVFCGVKVQVHDPKKHLRDASSMQCIVAPNHESAWETFFFCSYFYPVAPVMKRSLFLVPLLGWSFFLGGSIGIDRNAGRKAFKQIARGIHKPYNQQSNALLFPQGTRLQSGLKGKFHKGFVLVAKEAMVPILPVLHNGGRCWPKNTFIKHEANVHVFVGEPIDVKKASADEAYQAYETALVLLGESMTKVCNEQHTHNAA